ncbi:hypothetical protein TTHERM_000073142 (macronuclear) [Tetrahymena thermophila SB210]|uniref:Uncharacterized protein n=1 Tax=Tetrahymena thermophila (strain SB210) TaxID=312017 RepID=W7XAQ4_TETTS|nr:hypothetical protein TTHERM_000073142 [Tetrahymena thermophila SB210]EWS74417.1 hypothetical protein TTHERM_000073142 [Tetrahymena thermophila SB210]|eukprot:XP_012652994.1 hypothetical protein TTHERM_000073142 [Tetrahymena thermophila SB210]
MVSKLKFQRIIPQKTQKIETDLLIYFLEWYKLNKNIQKESQQYFVINQNYQFLVIINNQRKLMVNKQKKMEQQNNSLNILQDLMKSNLETQTHIDLQLKNCTLSQKQIDQLNNTLVKCQKLESLVLNLNKENISDEKINQLFAQYSYLKDYVETDNNMRYHALEKIYSLGKFEAFKLKQLHKQHIFSILVIDQEQKNKQIFLKKTSAKFNQVIQIYNILYSKIPYKNIVQNKIYHKILASQNILVKIRFLYDEFFSEQIFIVRSNLLYLFFLISKQNNLSIADKKKKKKIVFTKIIIKYPDFQTVDQDMKLKFVNYQQLKIKQE